jgi:hypothetical protein
MKNTAPQDVFTQDAMKVISAPRYVLIAGKKMSPSVLFSPALAESMLYWLVQSESQRLFGQNIMSLSVVSDKNMISHTRINEIQHTPAHSRTGDTGLGLASSLLLVSYSMDALLKPSRLNPKFDYEDVILTFRSLVSRKYKDGEVVRPNDVSLNNAIYDKIEKVSRINSPNAKKDLAR